MSFPIENFRIIVPVRAKNVKGMLVSISIYPISPAEASVIVVFNGKSNVKSMLKFDIPVDEELGKETTERTALYTALLSARDKVQVAVQTIANTVEEYSNGNFYTRKVVAYADTLGYRGKGFRELKIKIK